MNPKIVLHVGCEKTGSTSIQNSFIAAREELIASGTLFPRSIGAPTHVQLTACVLGQSPDHPIRRQLGLEQQAGFQDFVRSVHDRLKDEIAAVRPDRLIISDEHINVHLSNKSLLSQYRELLQTFGEIESVIIYIRRQDELRLSMFSQAVKNGAVKNIDLNNPLPTLRQIPYRFNYLKILDNLSDVFGSEKLIPRIYDRNLFVDRDVVRDFFDLVGLSNIPTPTLAGHEQNLSIDASVLARVGAVSRLLSNSKSRFIKERRVAFVRMCENAFTGPGAVMRPEDHDRFMSQFSAINEAVKQKYFGELSDSAGLFPASRHRKISDADYYPECTISWFAFVTGLAKAFFRRR